MFRAPSGNSFPTFDFNGSSRTHSCPATQMCHTVLKQRVLDLRNSGRWTPCIGLATFLLRNWTLAKPVCPKQGIYEGQEIHFCFHFGGRKDSHVTPTLRL